VGQATKSDGPLRNNFSTFATDLKYLSYNNHRHQPVITLKLENDIYSRSPKGRIAFQTFRVIRQAVFRTSPSCRHRAAAMEIWQG
jgi:hypothetical protein